ncbi:MAG: hypothetical protein D6678_02720 [Zetaproteobacteria bacterium]|nr:MAG: hypothetical protein D6678_02720 [Zetaproteobacteria bacterium]
MQLAIDTTDLVLTVLVAIGALQLAWFSVLLARKGIRAERIQQLVRPPLAIWVLFWPVYAHPLWIWAGLIALSLPVLLGLTSKRPFWLKLLHAWSTPAHLRGPFPPYMLPQIAFLAALAIAIAFFLSIPEFGLGLGLSLCLALTGADILDSLGKFRLGFPLHPEQTLPGHLLLILLCTLTLSWSIHVYHGIDWRPSLIATLIAGIVASIARAITPGMLHQATSVMMMGVTLWLL